MFVGSGTQDLGTGTYTIMAQQAAAGLGIDPSLVEVRLGDSTLPKAPVSGGSQSSASVLPAIQDATTQLKLKLADLAIADAASPLNGLKTWTSKPGTESSSIRTTRHRLTVSLISSRAMAISLWRRTTAQQSLRNPRTQ